MSTLTDFLTGVADAIRAKTGGSAPIPAEDFPAEIAAIETGTDTSDATVAAAQILAPYTAYGASGKLTGTIPSQQAKTVTPGTSAQTAIPAGTYAAGAATVSGDPNLVPENIKEGVSIFGVAGSFAGGGGFVLSNYDAFKQSCLTISNNEIKALVNIKYNGIQIFSVTDQMMMYGSISCNMIAAKNYSVSIGDGFIVIGSVCYIGTDYEQITSANFTSEYYVLV